MTLPSPGERSTAARENARDQWPYPALLSHSIKMYPVVQVAPELPPTHPEQWPPPMTASAAAFRSELSHLSNDGNQIYLHIPFCPFICHFCPLYKVTRSSQRTRERKERFVQHLLAEIERYGRSPAVRGQRFCSVYLGGGTPTELEPAQLARIMDALRASFRIDDDAEITLEGVAKQMTDAYLREAVAMGINRISFGVQTFDTSLRRLVGRGDAVDDYLALVRRARTRFPELKVNFEVMVGMPGQQHAMVADDLDQITSWGPDSVDLLYYVHMAGTRLSERARRQGLAPGCGDHLLALRELVNEHLDGAGYHALSGEVFSRNDRDLFTRCSFGGGGHCLNTVLGLGPSAFGIVNGTAYQNAPDLDRYEAAIDEGRVPVERALTLQRSDARARAWLLGVLRLHVSDALVTTAAERRRVRRWQRQGLITAAPGGYDLTYRGRLWYNHMQMETLTFADQLRTLPMLASVGDQLDAASAEQADPYWHEVRSMIRSRGVLGPLRLSAYHNYLRVRNWLPVDNRAVGFTGKVG